MHGIKAREKGNGKKVKGGIIRDPVPLTMPITFALIIIKIFIA
jgi:hypothetical protein